MGYSSIKMRILITKHPHRSLIFRKMILSRSVKARYGTQHNAIQHNDTQHKGLTCDTQCKDIEHNHIRHIDTQHKRGYKRHSA
jgi:hypothetical protein